MVRKPGDPEDSVFKNFDYNSVTPELCHSIIQEYGLGKLLDLQETGPLESTFHLQERFNTAWTVVGDYIQTNDVLSSLQILFEHLGKVMMIHTEIRDALLQKHVIDDIVRWCSQLDISVLARSSFVAFCEQITSLIPAPNFKIVNLLTPLLTSCYDIRRDDEQICIAIGHFIDFDDHQHDENSTIFWEACSVDLLSIVFHNIEHNITCFPSLILLGNLVTHLPIAKRANDEFNVHEVLCSLFQTNEIRQIDVVMFVFSNLWSFKETVTEESFRAVVAIFKTFERSHNHFAQMAMSSISNFLVMGITISQIRSIIGRSSFAPVFHSFAETLGIEAVQQHIDNMRFSPEDLRLVFGRNFKLGVINVGCDNYSSDSEEEDLTATGQCK
ncbi:hypothetical protein PCE1_002271 [Barthelona sp. PCE]